jgi:hypothetical protein
VRQRKFTCCPDGKCEDCIEEESRYRKDLAARKARLDPIRRRSRVTEQKMAWMNEALCQERDDLNWIGDADHQDNKREAKRLASQFCAYCPVRGECLLYGIASKSMGIWGGHYLSWEPRKKVTNLLGKL